MSMKSNILFKSLIAVSVLSMLAACTKDKKSKPSVLETSTVATQVTTELKVTQIGSEIKEEETPKVELSEATTVHDMTIKRLFFGDNTMDVLNPNPRRENGVTSSDQPSSLILALCGPRITNDNLETTSEINYPLALTSGSQMILRRDPNYRFGDGSTALSLPPYVLMTCQNRVAVTKSKELEGDGVSKVQVKRMALFGWAMEVIDTNPRAAGVSRNQQSVLTILLCAPRITDANIHNFNNGAYPILLTSGSQLVIRRDSNYQFGDGSNTSSAKPVVVVTCDL